MKLDFCAACGSTDDLQHHHLVTRGERGSNDQRNLITLCTPCHMKLHKRQMNGAYSASERISRAKANRKACSRYLGGKVPFGWRRAGPNGETVVEVPEEQAAIAEMIRLRLEERQPLRVVVNAMAKRGHTISHQSIVNITRRQSERETA